MKLANVDPESVNAILLDQTPSDLSDQWMVAGQVAMSASGESLTVRNTSWMPSKPGLGAICTMIFAPQVELRVNSDKTRIVGFIAGLGPKTIWDKPMDSVTKVQRTLDDLLGRDRKLVEKTCAPSGHEYRWNMLKPSQRIQSQAASETFFFRMIDGARLNVVRDHQAELEKLIKLYSVMDELNVNPLPY